ncbi:hypothetical protein WA026_010247 [Henosepilachna vigintioctopunctata]|uniref:Uncharacterized protein n=1 Tax=Henosepilachna vigintioctopunctata TaxID=420089 RepID=A0AAW1U9E0_9CUCU
MASKEWNNVTEKTIENCCKKCGFKEGEARVEEDCVAVDSPPSGDEAPERWSEVTKKLNIDELTFCEEFVSFDDDLAVCGELSLQFPKRRMKTPAKTMWTVRSTLQSKG